MLRAGDAADGEVAQAALDAWAVKRLATFEDAERGLMFGRLDFEAVERALYVGRRWVHDDEGEQIVVNWQGARGAAVLHRDTAGSAARDAPAPLPRRTQAHRHRGRGARRLDVLDGASVGDFLLEELERSRDTHARHRRDDPGRPVPGSITREPEQAVRDPGYPAPARRPSASTGPPG